MCNKITFILLLALLIAACGDEQCDPNDVHGTYRIHYEEQSGSCGDIPDIVVNLDYVDASACAMQSTQSGNECRGDVSGSCVVDGIQMRMSGYLVQSDGGDHIDGELTISVPGVCLSTYDVEYQRI